MKILILDQTEVTRLLPMADCMAAMSDALAALVRGEAVLPLRQGLRLPEGKGVFAVMPAYLYGASLGTNVDAVVGTTGVIGLKAITVFPGNHGTEYDSHQGAVLLFEGERGRLLAVLDASSVTAIRTAAVSGVATRLLAREDAAELAILGTGVQARTHLEAMRVARPIRRVRVFSREVSRARAFAEQATKRHGIPVEATLTCRDAVVGADIVCTVTSSPSPVLQGEWLAPGVHVNAVGASLPHCRELDTAAVVRSRLFVDRHESAQNEAGDFLIPKREGAIGDEHIQAELGEVVLGRNPGRRSPEEITLFKSLGLAVEDVAAARLVYANAERSEAGTWVELGESVIPPLEPVGLEDVRAAMARLEGAVLRTPLVPLNIEADIYLKLENLQPIGSFKLRGSGNALLAADPARVRNGVYTASAGNMAQGLAWWAGRLGVPCSAIVPEGAPQTKLAAIERLGAQTIKVPFERWWQTLVDHEYPGVNGLFVHPVSDPAVVAGNATIGIEILEDLPDVEAILVPFGGGGLACGIASAIRVLRPEVRVYACEVETAAPFAASLRAGSPQTIEHTASFVDGIGGKTVLAEMWPLAERLLAGSLVVPLPAVAGAVKLLAERSRVIAEGAGATPVAAALEGLAGAGKVVCVVSGGNIDSTRLIRILQGQVP